jgi:hypothetical protein
MSRTAVIISLLLALTIGGMFYYFGGAYSSFRGNLFHFISLVQKKEYKTAYNYLQDGYRNKVKLEQFTEMMKKSGLDQRTDIAIRYHVLHFLVVDNKTVFLDVPHKSGVVFTFFLRFDKVKLTNEKKDYRIRTIQLLRTKSNGFKSSLKSTDTASLIGLWSLKTADGKNPKPGYAKAKPTFLSFKKNNRYQVTVYNDKNCKKINKGYSGAGKWKYASRTLKFSEDGGGYYFSQHKDWQLLDVSKDRMTIWKYRDNQLIHGFRVQEIKCQ